MSLEETIQTLVRLALAEDLGERGDVTTRAILPTEATMQGQIVAKADGVMAGLPVLQAVYAQIDPKVEIQPCVADGDAVTRGTIVCTLRGSAQSLLTGERTALNFLQRLSGISTLTRQFVEAVQGSGAVILDTRKTTPGWRLLEKYAVRMGGAQNHRIGLFDAVMIKDNHIAAAEGITAAVEKVRAFPDADGLPIIVEVESLDQLAEVLPLTVDQILLDNMDDDTMRRAVEITAGRVPLEASGNMSLARAASVAATGVNFISVGALTHSAPAFDLSLRLE
ncbi:MAG: carboxylating nicotinate-nucleotide diphosphorylase [Anaerolineae bacterium]|nr:carboxylating nicotinate-nucleotide diphosphorylase [Anaerolineae bacterium]